MFMRRITAGATNVSVVVRVIDSTDGTPETAVEHNTTGMAMEYRREAAVSTAITEVALAALTTAHTDGGWEHIGNGYYRFDVPDAAFATGVSGVLIHGVITGMVVIGTYYELDPIDANVTQWLGTAAATPTVAGVPEVDVTHMAGGTQTVTDLKDFADAGYDPATNKVQGVVLVDTNTDMRGTDSAATAANLAIVDTNVDQIETAVITNAAGVDVAADIIALKAETASIQAETTPILADTADMQPKLGTPAGVSMSADIAAIEAQTDDIGVAGAGLTVLATAAALTTAQTDLTQIKADLPSKVTKNTALANFPFLMVNSTDHVTPQTAETVTATRSIDGAAFAACANAVVEIGVGMYRINLADTDLNGDTIILRFIAATSDDRFITIVTQP